jgi:hypothetical protein
VLGDEALGALVDAVQLDGLGKLDGRLEDLIRDQLRHDHRHAHRQARRVGDAPLHSLLQLPTEGDDLVGVTVDGAADVGEHHRTPRANEELLSERVL